MDTPVTPPFAPMLSKAAERIPDAPVGDILFEPKWDGFRCIVFRDGDEAILGSRSDKPLTRCFPEMLDPIRSMRPDRLVVDGELVVATDKGRDIDVLRARGQPA